MRHPAPGGAGCARAGGAGRSRLVGGPLAQQLIEAENKGNAGDDRPEHQQVQVVEHVEIDGLGERSHGDGHMPERDDDPHVRRGTDRLRARRSGREERDCERQDRSAVQHVRQGVSQFDGHGDFLQIVTSGVSAIARRAHGQKLD